MLSSRFEHGSTRQKQWVNIYVKGKLASGAYQYISNPSTLFGMILTHFMWFYFDNYINDYINNYFFLFGFDEK